MVHIEQEVKFRLPTAEAGLRMLGALGVEPETPRHFEANVLYDFADGRLTKRDEALRIRRAGDRAWLTWKGPRHGSGRVKQRRESETEATDAEALAAILEALGLVESFRYEKYRACYRLGDAEITLDETPIGAFVEIEASPERIAELAGRLGLDMSAAIGTSYPRLYELHRMEEPEAPEFMVFPDRAPAPPT